MVHYFPSNGRKHDRPGSAWSATTTVLSVADEAAIVAFRKHTLLPLDDCLYSLQPSIPRGPTGRLSG